jgi:serine/threonine-protein kinase
VSGFYTDNNAVRYADETKTDSSRGETLRALGAVGFFYRRSVTSFVGRGDVGTGNFNMNEPLREEGDADVRLDGNGRLRSLTALPVRNAARMDGPNWSELFVEAGLDPAAWTPVAPAERPRLFVDTRVAWEGVLLPGTAVRARVEATALEGRVVTFEIVGPWSSGQSRREILSGAASTPASRAAASLGRLALPLQAAVFLTAAFFARQNLRAGRGDRRGATRLSLFFGAVGMAAWSLTARDLISVQTVLGGMVILMAGMWVFYVAVEPFVRRRWPAMLVAWVRVLAGNLRDPLVGRDVLIGCTTGVAASALTALSRVIASQSGNTAAPLVPDWFMLNGTGPFVGAALAQFATGLFVSLSLLFFYFLLRVVVRSDWIALPLVALVSGLGRVVGSVSWATALIPVAGGALRAVALVRIGLVAVIVDSYVWTLFASSPMTLQSSAWYASTGYAALAIVGALAVYGYATATAGRSSAAL